MQHSPRIGLDDGFKVASLKPVKTRRCEAPGISGAITIDRLEMKDTTRAKIAEIEAAQAEAQKGKAKRRITLAEAEAAQVKAERSRRRELKGKNRTGLKSAGWSWLTPFQRAVSLAFTDIKKHGLTRSWLTRKIKLPKETL